MSLVRSLNDHQVVCRTFDDSSLAKTKTSGCAVQTRDPCIVSMFVLDRTARLDILSVGPVGQQKEFGGLIPV